jgi:hypothetical protein
MAASLRKGQWNNLDGSQYARTTDWVNGRAAQGYPQPEWPRTKGR